MLPFLLSTILYVVSSVEFPATQNHYFVTFFNHDYIINDVIIKNSVSCHVIIIIIIIFYFMNLLSMV